MAEDNDVEHAQDGELVRFDPDHLDAFSLAEPAYVHAPDIAALERMDILSVTTESIGGETVATECELDIVALAGAIGEFDAVERNAGDTWASSGWNPNRFLKYVRTHETES